MLWARLDRSRRDRTVPESSTPAREYYDAADARSGADKTYSTAIIVNDTGYIEGEEMRILEDNRTVTGDQRIPESHPTVLQYVTLNLSTCLSHSAIQM